MVKVTALIPAAGIGKRMGRGMAKQFLPLGGMPMLAHTLLAFQRTTLVDDIIPILSRDDMEGCLRDIVERYNITKVKTVVAGGKERQDSVMNGLHKLGEDVSVVLVHDGVRPFVTEEMIRTSIEFAQKGECVAVGVPVKDTVKEVDDQHMVHRTLERSRLWAIQTPQTFPVKILKHAYEHSYKHSLCGTDDAMLVERSGGKVRVIMGSYENIKITTPEDLILAEEILKRR